MPFVICKDSFQMSVQASLGHYCSPRTDNPPSGYTHYEVGYPNEREPLLDKYKEMACDIQFPPTSSVYPWVPKEVIQDIIAKHGGLVETDELWEVGSPDYWAPVGTRAIGSVVSVVNSEVRISTEEEVPRLLQGHQDGIGIACAQSIESSDVARTISSHELEMFMENLSNTLEENTIT